MLRWRPYILSLTFVILLDSWPKQARDCLLLVLNQHVALDNVTCLHILLFSNSLFGLVLVSDLLALFHHYLGYALSLV